VLLLFSTFFFGTLGAKLKKKVVKLNTSRGFKKKKENVLRETQFFSPRILFFVTSPPLTRLFYFFIFQTHELLNVFFSQQSKVIVYFVFRSFTLHTHSHKHKTKCGSKHDICSIIIQI
jgi:hypothetical protein